MLLRMLHTADLHLGMRFTRGYTDAVQQNLIDARFECLERLVSLSNEKKCDLFVVAGDMFDRVKTAQANILRALKALEELETALAVVLPGNHDYFQDEAGFIATSGTLTDQVPWLSGWLGCWYTNSRRQVRLYRN